MLRSEHSIVEYRDGVASPDRLTRNRHREYLAYADRMLAVYRSGKGMPRRELHRSVENILSLAEDCDRRRIAAFCKLLDDRSEFAKDPRGSAAALRLRTFTLAAAHHPLISSPGPGEERESEIKSHIATQLGRSWPELEAGLYADVIDFQPLLHFEGYESPAALLSAYNVAQLRACLYRAESLSVDAAADFKTILRYAKLSRLMHEIHRLAPGRYKIDLSGPASVLHQTRRYGIHFARFLSGLLSCRDWHMHAILKTRWGGTARLGLHSDEGYQSHVAPPNLFDSSVEEAFATDFGSQRDAWKLTREDAILHEGQTTFVPDFVLRHRDGHEVLLEIVGFWTDDYLERKRQTLLRFAHRPILIAVAETNRRQTAAPAPACFVFYRKRIDPEAVTQVLNAIRS